MTPKAADRWRMLRAAFAEAAAGLTGDELDDLIGATLEMAARMAAEIDDERRLTDDCTWLSR